MLTTERGRHLDFWSYGKNLVVVMDAIHDLAKKLQSPT